MKAKRISIIGLAVIIALLMGVLAVAPFSAMAADEPLTISSAGVASWGDFNPSGYRIVVTHNESLYLQVPNTYALSYNLKEALDEKNAETGEYFITVNAVGSGIKTEKVAYSYTSPNPELEVPTGLVWNGSVASWNAVANAESYKVQLVDKNGGSKISQTIATTSYDFLDYFENSASFKVIATADGYQDSNEATSDKSISYLVKFLAGAGTGSKTNVVVTPAIANGEVEYTVPGPAGFYSPGAGYEFNKWEISYATGPNQGETAFAVANDTFVVNGDVVFSAMWKTVTYTVTLLPNNDGANMPIEIEGQTGTYVLPECTFTAPQGKEFSHWAFDTIYGTEYSPSQGYLLNNDVRFVAVWKDKAFSVSPGNAVVATNSGYTFDYKLSVDTVQVNVQLSTDGGNTWANYSILASPAPEKNTLTSGTINCPASNWTGTRLLRLQAFDAESHQFYSDSFTVEWIESVFAVQPQNLEVPLNVPALLTFELNTTPDSLIIERDKGEGVWEFAQGTGADNYAIISARDTAFVGTYRLRVAIGGNSFYSSTFTISWTDSASYEFTTNPTGDKLLSGNSHNANWAVNFAVTKYEILGYIGEEWVTVGVYAYPDYKAPGSAEDFDFDTPGLGKGSYGYKVVAYIDDAKVIECETFYINWVSYTVSFNANGGDGTMDADGDQFGGYILPENAFTAPEGKVFKAWAIGGVEGTQYAEGEEYDVQEDVTFYAVWEDYSFVDDYDELVSAVNSGAKYIKLTKNIAKAVYGGESLESNLLRFSGSGTTTLDLDTYTIEFSNENELMGNTVSWIKVEDSHELTIINGSLILNNSATTDQSAYGAIYLEDNATLITSDVIVRNKKNGSAVRAHDDATVMLNGGQFYTLSGWSVMTMHTASLTLDDNVQLYIEIPGNASSSLGGGLNAISEGDLIINEANIRNGMNVYKTKALSISTHVIFFGNTLHTKALNVYSGDITAGAQDETYYWKENGNYLYLDNATISGDTPVESVSFYSKSKKYDIEVISGSASANRGYYTEEITITADYIEGKIFKEWVADGEHGIIFDDLYSATTTFKMVSAKVTITAIYENAPITNFNIDINAPIIGEMFTRNAMVDHEGLMITTEANENPEWDIQWDNVTDSMINLTNGVYLPGKEYMALLRVEINSVDWKLDYENLNVTINGSIAQTGSASPTYVVVFTTFQMPNTDFAVEFTSNSYAGLGGTLEVDEQAIKDSSSIYENGEFYYYWLKNDEVIGGAYGNSYKIQPSDADAKIRVLVNVRGESYDDYYGLSEEKLVGNKAVVINLTVDGIEGDCYPDFDMHKAFTLIDTDLFTGPATYTWNKDMDGGFGAQMTETDVLEVGNKYWVTLIFRAKDGVTIDTDNLVLIINGGEPDRAYATFPTPGEVRYFYTFTSVEHTHVYGDVYTNHDEDGHWKECIYDYCAKKAESEIEYTEHYSLTATCQTPGTCPCGQTGIYADHNFMGDWAYLDDTCHGATCTTEGCGEISDIYTQDHTGGTATCYAKAVCEYCHEEYGAMLDHNYGDDGWDYKVAGGHAHECENVGCTHHDEIVPHVPNIPNATEEQDKVCTLCGFVMEPALNHVHVLTPVQAVAPSCLVAGNSAYYTCACGQWFSDENATNLIENHDSVIIPATDHDYEDVDWSHDEDNHYKVCKNDNCEEKSQVGAHIPNMDNPTEEEAKVCTVCGYVIAPALSHVHSLTPVQAVAPSCLVAGNTAYYTCACGQWFSDENATNVIANHDSVILPATNHNYEDVLWTTTETEHYKVCKNDNCEVESERGNHSGGTATCTEKAVCSTCGVAYGTTLDHTYGDWTVALEPTTTSEGVLKRTCGCGHNEVKPIKALVVTNGYDYVITNNPTATQAGSATYTMVIEGETYTFTVVLPALGEDASEQEGGEEGLTGGAIAGIVVGSVFGALALAVGGFAIFWFVIKKKSVADLLAIIKKTPKTGSMSEQDVIVEEIINVEPTQPENPSEE